MRICDIDKCVGCGACAANCKNNCIYMKFDEEGFLYPDIDTKKCLGCNICRSVCPVINTRKVNTDMGVIAYAAYNRNMGIRERSSSGGIFYLLAKRVIELGGIVVGAGFDKRKHVQHYIVDSEEKIEIIMGSKYIQSNCCEILEQIKSVLVAGRWVLFSGTACQVAGLRSYLKIDYSNLLCVDVVCHGVPSTKVWDKYLNSLTNTKDRIGQIQFRNKKTGWQNYSVVIKNAEHDEIYSDIWHKNVFMQGFVNDLYLRKSCYQCQYKGDNLQGDITLGDLWGVDNICPELNDDKGISLVLVRTPKGKEIYEEIEKDIVTHEIPFEQVVKYNPSILQSSANFEYRKLFYEKWNGEELARVIKAVLERRKA